MDRAYVMELVKSFQTGGMTRRQFTKRATVALGGVAMVNLLLVAFYGSPLTPEESTEVKAPVLGLYGDKDQSNPVDIIRTRRKLPCFNTSR